MANPTTNYGWPMPTSTDLVTDLPADFALFGQPVDTSLKALNPETTLGDIAYRSSTSNTNTRLGIGSTSQILTVVAGVPAWATPAVAASGYTQITSGSFSSAASVTVDSVFSATYKRYQVFLRYIFITTGGSLLWQYRYAGPTTDASANYLGSGFRQNRSNTKTDYGYTNTTSGTLDTGGATNTNSILLMTLDQVGNSAQIPYNFQQGLSSDSQAIMQSSMYFSSNRTFTGFILTPSAGTLTGEYAVYGLAN